MKIFTPISVLYHKWILLLNIEQTNIFCKLNTNLQKYHKLVEFTTVLFLNVIFFTRDVKMCLFFINNGIVRTNKVIIIVMSCLLRWLLCSDCSIYTTTIHIKVFKALLLVDTDDQFNNIFTYDIVLIIRSIWKGIQNNT